MGKHGTTRLTATHRIVLPAATAAVLLGLSAPVAVADDAAADATSSDQWPGMRSATW